MNADELLHHNQQLQTELAETKFELLRTQARLHQVQEELEQLHGQVQASMPSQQRPDHPVQLQIEQVFAQMRTQHRYAQDQLLLLKASMAYADGQLLQMTQYLEQMLHNGPFEPQAMVTDWLTSLHQFAQEKGLALDMRSLVNSAEWKDLMRQLVMRDITL